MFTFKTKDLRFYFDTLAADAGVWEGTLHPDVYLAKWICLNEWPSSQR